MSPLDLICVGLGLLFIGLAIGTWRLDIRRDREQRTTTSQGRRLPPRPPRSPAFTRNENATRVADTTGPQTRKRGS